jgi:metallo-beta-lactamase class B
MSPERPSNIQMIDKMIINGLQIVFVSLLGIVSSMAQTNDSISIDNDIQLIHLQDSIFVHVTWHQSGSFGRFPSNGLIVVKKGQALMIDTPMDNEKTERLTRYLEDSLSVNLTKLIVGHFHDDCMGGLEYLQSKGIESIANLMTVAKCKELGLPIPSIPFSDSLAFDFNGERIECQFFGAGHSFDNITVWIPGKGILFGGCLIRSLDSKGLGNLTDADVNDWDMTVKNVMRKYPEIQIVIPGHGSFGDIELLTHTIELVQKEKNK